MVVLVEALQRQLAHKRIDRHASHFLPDPMTMAFLQTLPHGQLVLLHTMLESSDAREETVEQTDGYFCGSSSMHYCVALVEPFHQCWVLMACCELSDVPSSIVPLR
jgi:hypothetical protein